LEETKEKILPPCKRSEKKKEGPTPASYSRTVGRRSRWGAQKEKGRLPSDSKDVREVHWGWALNTQVEEDGTKSERMSYQRKYALECEGQGILGGVASRVAKEPGGWTRTREKERKRALSRGGLRCLAFFGATGRRHRCEGGSRRRIGGGF